MISFSRGIDPRTGEPFIMCPICFESNDLISARAGGRLSTNEDGSMSDVCVTCATKEYLRMAAAMGA